MEITSFSGKRLNESFVRGELSAEQIARAFLERIARFDGAIGAFTKVLDSQCLQQAIQLDQRRAAGEPLGRLAGIPIAVKDLIHLRGCETTCGSNAMRHYVAAADASAVARLRKEDALLLGKTNLDAFGMGSSTEHSDIQLTRNPWDLRCTPGGSSGGSAAAVAARFCPVALGSDTGGSIRQPASYCGIFGFKPTYGRVSRQGLVAYASSFDQIGPLAHTHGDLALIFDVIAGPCPGDATTLDRQPGAARAPAVEMQAITFGICTALTDAMDKEARTNFHQSLASFQTAGGRIVEIDLLPLRAALAAYYVIACAEASSNLARFAGVGFGYRSPNCASAEQMSAKSRRASLHREVKRRILMGTFALSEGQKSAYYDKAQQVRAQIADCLTRARGHCDVIALPTAPTSAFELGQMPDSPQMYSVDAFTISSNLAGLPAISLPAGFSNCGRPFGMQLIGAPLADESLLRMAGAAVDVLQRSRSVLGEPSLEETAQSGFVSAARSGFEQ